MGKQVKGPHPGVYMYTMVSALSHGSWHRNKKQTQRLGPLGLTVASQPEFQIGKVVYCLAVREIKVDNKKQQTLPFEIPTITKLGNNKMIAVQMDRN